MLNGRDRFETKRDWAVRPLPLLRTVLLGLMDVDWLQLALVRLIPRVSYTAYSVTPARAYPQTNSDELKFPSQEELAKEQTVLPQSLKPVLTSVCARRAND